MVELTPNNGFTGMSLIDISKAAFASRTDDLILSAAALCPNLDTAVQPLGKGADACSALDRYHQTLLRF